MIIHQVSSEVVRVDAPAKINLFLEVLNRRPDGYHNINSLFQAVSLYDKLSFSRWGEPGISLSIAGAEGPHLETGPGNLICRAWELMQREFGLPGGVEVDLEKNIPLAAGLAGGSSDAAATLAACNILFELDLDTATLQQLGLRLGSDIPFFFSCGQALVRGRGEIIEEVTCPKDYRLILVNPGFAVSTAAGYAALKRDLTHSTDPFSLPCCRGIGEFIGSLRSAGNDFETVCFRDHPELRTIRDRLKQRGAALARMSGSGPTIFGIFTEISSRSVEEIKRWGNWRMDTVAPITLQKQATSLWRHRGNHRDQGDVAR